MASYEKMFLIRTFEERLLTLFGEGKLNGTTHTCVGQEANAVAVVNHLIEGDVVFSAHRCHGHYLARFDDPKGLLAEIVGKDDGICGGRGGSQHLHAKDFYSSGVQGGIVPISVGAAFVEKKKGNGNIVVCFIGDGTFGQGVVYESFNLASLLQVPWLVVVENNFYAQTTPLSINFAGSMTDRAKAFGISAGEIESTKIEELDWHFQKVISQVRSSGRPHMEVIHTYRLRAHSKGDDFRDEGELRDRWNFDPIKFAGEKLDATTRAQIETRVKERMARVESEVFAKEKTESKMRLEVDSLR